MKKGLIKATGPFERVVHWCLALSCFLLCITGMGTMYHSLNFIGYAMGGMANLRMLHHYGGLFFGASLLVAIVIFGKEAFKFSSKEDWPWIKEGGGFLWHVEDIPDVGKFNPGQKMFFLVVVLGGLAMLASGLIMWFPLNFGVELVRTMYVVHSFGFLLIFAFVFVHLYLVTIGAPGSAPAMFTGWVTRGWMKKQHPKWLKEMEKDGTLEVYGGNKASGSSSG